MIEQTIRQFITEKLLSVGVTADPNSLETSCVFLLISALFAYLLYLIGLKIVVKIIHRLLHAQKDNVWGRTIKRHKVFERVTFLIPLLFISLMGSLILAHHPFLDSLVERSISIAIVVSFTLLIFSLLDAIDSVSQLKEIHTKVPIRGITQLLKVIAAIVATVIIFCIIIDKSPVILLSGFGMATGLIMLVFKDTLLGFVAGIQLSANKMVAINDWIEMDRFGANGTVEDISLTNVKVRNFDNTITMLPAYALIQNPFINWQGMTAAGGRRIKRAVYLDLTSIRYLTHTEVDTLLQLSSLTKALSAEIAEIRAFNQTLKDEHSPNHKALSNIGVFRLYLSCYLKDHPDIHRHMLTMVRQLEPTSEGLPLQIYTFTQTTDWAAYEDIQSSIFDHIYLIMPMFGLLPFQQLMDID